SQALALTTANSQRNLTAFLLREQELRRFHTCLPDLEIGVLVGLHGQISLSRVLLRSDGIDVTVPSILFLNHEAIAQAQRLHLRRHVRSFACRSKPVHLSFRSIRFRRWLGVRLRSFFLKKHADVGPSRCFAIEQRSCARYS